MESDRRGTTLFPMRSSMVKIHDVPIQAFTEDGLSIIASTIGKPIIYLTIGIPCEDDRFSIKSVSIEYEWKPPCYDLCKIFGHSHDYCHKKVLIPIVDTSKVITPNVSNISTVHIPSVEKTNDGFQTVGKKKKKKGKSKSNNGDQFVGNTSNSSSLMKNTINSSNQDNITSSNSFAALNEDVEEGEVENVFDETANLFKSKTGGRSSFMAAVG
ncbi:hypothetical protein Tco_0011585 [Tanacetum coccineum]